jgi:hypothetical protein
VSGPLEKDQYCREIETYLCRKNQGHLIRIVGPAFERVCSWADRGVPLKVACRGIDRYVDRQQAKGPQRRPVRVEFCEADVLDIFDEWRRAVGVTAEHVGGGDSGASETEPEGSAAARSSLASHIERTIAALRLARGGGHLELTGLIDDAVREIEAMRTGAGPLRGAARQAALARLRALDAELIAAVCAHMPTDRLTEIASEADEQLAPFKDRMPMDAHRRAREACVERLLRERAGLPVIAFE